MIYNEKNESITINGVDIPLLSDEYKENIFFNAKLICKALNYIDHEQALRDNLDDLNDKDELVDYKYIKKNYTIEHLPYKEYPQTKYLTEEGLYEFLMRSNKPGAREIRRYVNRIIKTLRNDKIYILEQESYALKRQLEIKTAEYAELTHYTNEFDILDEFNKALKKNKNDIIETTYKKMPILTICELKYADCPNRVYLYNYYIIRCQRRSLEARFNKIKKNYDVVKIIKIWDDPNSIAIFNSINVISYKNRIRLHKDYSIDQLINYVEKKL